MRSVIAAIVPIVMCEAPIEFEYRDGLIYISNPAGFHSVLRPHTFFASFHNAAQCIQECQESFAGEVVRQFKVLDGGKS